jgi:hypothetical protein
MTFELNIGFTNEQLDVLYKTGTNLIIAKPSAGGTPNVAWLSINPLQSNKITWDENYGIYVSTTKLEHGAEIVQVSSVDVGAATEKIYTLKPSGAISDPIDGGVEGSFTLLNQYNPHGQLPYITAGLYQDANVNGTAILGHAISAAPVLYQNTAVMTPFTTVYVWLQSSIKSNCVITTVTSNMTPLLYGGNLTKHFITYSSNDGKFIEG